MVCHDDVNGILSTTGGHMTADAIRVPQAGVRRRRYLEMATNADLPIPGYSRLSACGLVRIVALSAGEFTPAFQKTRRLAQTIRLIHDFKFP
jgi:hypothetical protein